MLQNLAILVVAGFMLLAAKVSCNVFSKAGFPKYFGLLLLVPVINFIAIYALAFTEWPIEKEMRR